MKCIGCSRPGEFLIRFVDKCFGAGSKPVCARHLLRGLRNGFPLIVGKIPVAPVANPARKGTKLG